MGGLVSAASSFAALADLLDAGHDFLCGQRARFLNEGFNETAAEQMCVALWRAYVSRLFG